MTPQEKKLRKLERMKKQMQTQTQTYRAPSPVKKDEETVFVPSRGLMYQKIMKDTLENEEVKKAAAKLPRHERREYIRRVVRTAIDTIRAQMTEQMRGKDGQVANQNASS